MSNQNGSSGGVPDSLESLLDATNLVAAGIATMIAQTNEQSLSDANKMKFIESIVAARQFRTSLFENDLFGEPAWDMLLDLRLAEYAERRTSVSSLCRASGVAATTALRWIGVLERKGLIRRTIDEADRRRMYLSLAPDCRATIDHLIERSVADFFQKFALK